VGLVDVSIEATHAVGDGLHGAIIKAVKPVAPPRVLPAMPELPRPTALTMLADGGCGCGEAGCC
jgi:hypothetical protein